MASRPGANVLVVDDEDVYVEALTAGLTRELFDVRAARTADEAMSLFEADRPDLILLDVMLPDRSGVDVVRSLRRRSNVPIIMLSSRSTDFDVAVALEVGADDYVFKPYRIRELVARMRAVMRRATTDATPDTGPDRSDQIAVGDLILDAERHEIIFRGAAARIPLKEFELLRLLMLNARKVVTRKVAIEQVWGKDYVGDTKTLDVHVKRLRARFESGEQSSHRIVTVRGVGFRFEPVAAS